MPAKNRASAPSTTLQPHAEFVEALQHTLARIPRHFTLTREDERGLKRARLTVEAVIEQLERYRRELDLVEDPQHTFQPGSYQSVAELIVNALLRDARVPLGGVRPYYGSGIYALYYHGAHPAYALISGTDIPIYAGAASPSNFRAATPRQQGTALFVRQRDHADSVREAESHDARTLRLEDFTCRKLVVESGWEVAAESYLIRHFRPIWNKESKVCEGLGKHGDSSSTRGNRRSKWDTLHPGRGWATGDDNRPNRLSEEEIIQGIWRHCLEHYAEASLNQAALAPIKSELSGGSTVADSSPKRADGREPPRRVLRGV